MVGVELAELLDKGSHLVNGNHLELQKVAHDKFHLCETFGVGVRLCWAQLHRARH